MKLILFITSIVSFVSANEISIFNGKDLTGWQGDPKFWSIEDGAITGKTTPENVLKHNSFLIWKEGEVSDFVLTFKYKTTPENTNKYTNSGVQYRSKVIDAANFIVGGYQADLEYGKNYSGILYEEKGRGILAQRGQQVIIKQGETPQKPILEIIGKTGEPAEMEAAIRKDDWNDYKIVANGNNVQHYINGHLNIDVKDTTTEAPKRGVIALQIHQGPPMKIQFKDFLLKTNLVKKKQ